MQNRSVTIKEYTRYNEAEILHLYASVGWTEYTKNMATLMKGFENSLCILAAYSHNDELIGIIRAVGDGETIVFIQDILIDPRYQHQGIGTTLMRAILSRYSAVRQIELTTDNTPKTISFYKSLGFREFSLIDCCGFMCS